jgi:superfamily II DNA or RNA helicase
VGIGTQLGWTVGGHGARVHPVDARARAALSDLVEGDITVVDAVLRAAAAQRRRVDAYTYATGAALLNALDWSPRRGRLLLRHPGGFDQAVVDRLPARSQKTVRVLEMPGPHTAHAKVFLIHLDGDRRLVISGSSNGTRSGLRFNVEVNFALLLEGPVSDPSDPRLLFEELWSSSLPWDRERFGPTPLVRDDAAALLPYQRDAMAALDAHLGGCLATTPPAWARGPDVPAAMVSLPTGAGKTFLAMRWVLERVPTYLDGSAHPRVLWLAHTDDLLDQAESTLARTLATDLDPSFAAMRLQPSHEDLAPLANAADFVFGTRKLLASRDGQLERMRPFDVVVVDEAHHVADATVEYPAILAGVRHAVRVGITATSYRTDAAEEPGMYAYFNPAPEEGSAERPVFRRTLAELERLEVRGQRIFAERVHETIVTGQRVDMQGARNDADLHRQGEALGLWRKRRVDAIAAHYRQSAHFPALVFAMDIRDANAITKAFLRRGVRAQALHTGEAVGCLQEGRLSRGQRREAVDLLRHPDPETLEVIVSVDLFIEGLDIPSLESVFMARPTFSPRVYLQMRGRGLRGPAVRGTERCIVVRVQDDVINAGLTLMDDAQAESLEAFRSHGAALEETPPAPFVEASSERRAAAFLTYARFRGWMPVDDAIADMADWLRARGEADYGRLDRRGRVWAAIVDAIDTARRGRWLLRRRGRIQAVLPDPDDFAEDDWARTLLAVLDEREEADDPEAVLRDAAAYARERVGLAYQRLRADGRILTALRGALQSSLAARRVREDDGATCV